MKQTAVALIFEKFNLLSDKDFKSWMLNNYDELFEMEKEQIMEAREDGHLSTYAEYGSTPKCYLDGGHEEYYNETFKSE